MSTTTSEPIVMFRRDSFYGEFGGQQPKWHVLKEIHVREGIDEKWGTYEGWCGYAKSNLLGDLRVSRSKTKKSAKVSCGRCLSAIAKHEKNNRPTAKGKK